MRSAIAAICFLFATVPALAKEPGATPGRHALEGNEVSIYNIAGEMTVVRGTGNAVVAEITPVGRDAGRLTVRETTTGGSRTLSVIYPEERIVYPGSGDGHWGSVQTDSYRGQEGRRFRISGSGPGLEAHADIRVTVPRGKRLNLYLAVGRASISDVEGEIHFEGASAAVEGERLSGSLEIETGSGEVSVTRSKGDVAVEAGSGRIRISEVDGTVSAEAGSGTIELTRVGGGKVNASAGSGAVTGSDIKATELTAGAGSGEVNLDGVSVSKLSADSGSGSIRVRLLGSADDVHLDAGSGSITLEVSQSLGARFRIECPTRRLHIDFPVEIEHKDDDVTVGRIGDGKGRIDIDAGSGSVRLSRI